MKKEMKKKRPKERERKRERERGRMYTDEMDTIIGYEWKKATKEEAEERVKDYYEDKGKRNEERKYPRKRWYMGIKGCIGGPTVRMNEEFIKIVTKDPEKYIKIQK
jgi:hypothetical protein